MIRMNSLYVLIMRAHDQSMLVEHSNRLPLIHNVNQSHRNISEFCKFIKRKLALTFDLIFLRSECEVYFEVCESYLPKLYIFEVLYGKRWDLPKKYGWKPKHEADQIVLYQMVPSVDQFLVEYKTMGVDVNGHRLLPYSRRGWFTRASEWMKSRVAILTENEIVHVRQHSVSSVSCIIHGTDKEGSEYTLKDIPFSENSSELECIIALNDIMKDDFCRPLKVDLRRRWLLMQIPNRVELAINALDIHINPELAKNVLLDWVRIQKKSISLAGQLANAGIPVLNGKELIHRTNTMINDPDWFSAQMEGLERFEREHEKEGYTRKVLNGTKKLVAKLSEYKVPLCLVHGQLTPVSVMKMKNGQFTYMNFENTCISYPFLDIVMYSKVCNMEPQDMDFYLEKWLEFENMDRLKEMITYIEQVLRLQWSWASYRAYVTSEQGNLKSAYRSMSFPDLR